MKVWHEGPESVGVPLGEEHVKASVRPNLVDPGLAFQAEVQICCLYELQEGIAVVVPRVLSAIIQVQSNIAQHNHPVVALPNQHYCLAKLACLRVVPSVTRWHNTEASRSHIRIPRDTQRFICQPLLRQQLLLRSFSIIQVYQPFLEKAPKALQDLHGSGVLRLHLGTLQHDAARLALKLARGPPTGRATPGALSGHKV